MDPKQMNEYVGTKRLRATPMTLGEYNALREWGMPGDENPQAKGYLVEYMDGRKPNVEGFEGYVSWSPDDVFKKSYNCTSDGMTFGQAMEMMRLGRKVKRIGGNEVFSLGSRNLTAIHGVQVSSRAIFITETTLHSDGSENHGPCYGATDCLSIEYMLYTDWVVVGQATVAEKPDMGNVSDGYHTFNELYEHRMALFSAIVSAYPERSWKSKKHFDDEKDPMFDGYFVVGVETPAGEATYHYKLEVWDMFNCKEVPRAPKWDGHSNSDVVQRLLTLRTTA